MLWMFLLPLICVARLSDLFDASSTHIYVISTDLRRFNHMNNLLTNLLGLSDLTNHVTFLDGTKSQSLNHVALMRMVRNGTLSMSYTKRTAFRPSRIACQLSHIHALSTFLKSTHCQAIIFEDDIIVSNVFGDGIQNSLSNFITLEVNWDLTYLGFCFETLSNIGSYSIALNTSYSKVPTFYTTVQGALCRHAILYRRPFVEKLLSSVYPINTQGDKHLREAIRKYQAIALRPLYPLFDQNRVVFGSMLNNSKTMSTFRISL
jgi:GR25 family glycosyltransferase involved in LPS biosynthesis